MTRFAAKPVNTKIPVQLNENEFEQFILPYLSLPKKTVTGSVIRGTNISVIKKCPQLLIITAASLRHTRLFRSTEMIASFCPIALDIFSGSPVKPACR
ncbi:MAG: hypothetical protein GY874_17975 [Desulfobacteraceae bacterium]|nr:hypothetical protein [Desulfobacteraceae bacterium]